MKKDQKNPEVENEREIKKDLDLILMELEKESGGNKLPTFGSPEIIATSKIVNLDYEQLTIASTNKATEIVHSIVDFYLPQELQEKDFVKNKMSLDILTISNMIFNMETSEHVIKILIFEIESGNFNPRMFEVLSQLQKSKMEIVKHLTQVEIIMENNYKQIFSEYMAKIENNQIEEKNINDVYNSIGTKNILQRIQKKININDNE